MLEAGEVARDPSGAALSDQSGAASIGRDAWSFFGRGTLPLSEDMVIRAVGLFGVECVMQLMWSIV
jgi:hypothetical protein